MTKSLGRSSERSNSFFILCRTLSAVLAMVSRSFTIFFTTFPLKMLGDSSTILNRHNYTNLDYKSSAVPYSGPVYVPLRLVSMDPLGGHNSEVDIHKLFCKNLGMIRNDRELTQQDMADKLDITLRSYQALEYGWRNGTDWPRPERIKKLSKILKCKQSELFKE